MPIAPIGKGPCVPTIGDMPLFGVIGRTDLPLPINGDSRLDRESIVRGDALGEGTAAGKYGL